MSIYKHITLGLLIAALAVILIMFVRIIIGVLKERYVNRYYYEEVQTFGVDKNGHYLLQDSSGNLWLFENKDLKMETGTYIIKIDTIDGDGDIVGIYKKIEDISEE